MKIYNKDEITRVTKLDDDALAAVEAGFASLGRDEVTMPPFSAWPLKKITARWM